MAEVLIVVAIIGVLMGLAIPNIMQQQRDLKKMELDRTAKEIYLSVQNSFVTLSRNGHLNEAINGKLLEGGGIEGKDASYVSDALPSDYSGDFKGIFYTFYSGDDSSRLYKNYLETGSLKALGCDFVAEYTSNGDVYSIFYAEDAKTAAALKSAGLTADLKALNSFRDNEKVGYYSSLTLSDRYDPDAAYLDEVVLGEVEDDLVNNELSVKIKIKDDDSLYGANPGVKYTLDFSVGENTYKKTIETNTTSLNREDGYLVYKLVLDSLPNNVHFYRDVVDNAFAGNGSIVTLSLDSVNVNTSKEVIAMKASDRAIRNFNPLHYVLTSSAEGNIGISSARHLSNLDEEFYDASGVSEANINQMADIDASPISKAIRNDKLFVSGTKYEGANYDITNLNITSADADYAGLFAEFNGCEVRNLEFIDPHVSASAEYTGVLCGKVAGGSIFNCGSRRSSGGNKDNPGDYWNVTGTSNCGGLIGYASGVNVSQSYAAVNVQGDGGFAGSLLNSIVSYCYSSGVVENRSSYAGGFAASVSGTISNCYTTSDLIGGNNLAGFAYICNGANECDAYGRVGDELKCYELYYTEDNTFFGFASEGSVSDCVYYTLPGYNDFVAYNTLGLGLGEQIGYNMEPTRAGYYYTDTLRGHGGFPFEAEGFINPHYGDWPHYYSVVAAVDAEYHRYICYKCQNEYTEEHLPGDVCDICGYPES